MKKIIFLLVIIALFSCEKERCFECTVTTSGYGMSQTNKSIICGTMSRKEAKDAANPASVSSSGIIVRVTCREQ